MERALKSLSNASHSVKYFVDFESIIEWNGNLQEEDLEIFGYIRYNYTMWKILPFRYSQPEHDISFATGNFRKCKPICLVEWKVIHA